MSLFNSPPTTSGVVVLSGSNFFDLSGDFPVVPGLFIDSDATANNTPRENTFLILDTSPQDTSDTFDTLILKQLTQLDPSEQQPRSGEIQATVLRINEDIGISENLTTTSGIVILDIFTGAGTPQEPFVPPVVINERLFPRFQGALISPPPGRIFPVLPQSSTLTPGD